jgi:hypothetical protein
LRLVWIAYAKGDDFRNNLLKILDSYKTLKKDNPVLHWLGDTSKLSVMSLTDQNWTKLGMSFYLWMRVLKLMLYEPLIDLVATGRHRKAIASLLYTFCLSCLIWLHQN